VKFFEGFEDPNVRDALGSSTLEGEVEMTVRDFFISP
jgi:hypothetical protein